MTVAELLAAPQLELMPTRDAADRFEGLPEWATVTVTCAPRRGLAPTLDLVERLAARGFRAVPHVAARQVRDAAELAGVLGRLDRAGVREAFVVAGDALVPAGEFPDGPALLRAMDRLGHSLTRIGVPGYPEGHPSVPDDALWAALREKQPHAHYVVTQMCFDAAALRGFVAEARRRGITLPVLVGLPGAVDAGTLLRLGVRIGVGDSLRFALGHRGVAGTLLRPGRYRPDALLGELDAGEFAGLHLFTFNQVDPTLRWLTEARRRAAA